jgi:hypothetical protein
MNAPSFARRRVAEGPPRRPSAELRALRVVVEPDLDPDTSYLGPKRGEDTFVGVRVEADVLIKETLQTLSSSGLWGIESDAEIEYLDEVIAQEWDVLRGVLKAVGVPTDQLPLKASREWIDWRI